MSYSIVVSLCVDESVVFTVPESGDHHSQEACEGHTAAAKLVGGRASVGGVENCTHGHETKEDRNVLDPVGYANSKCSLGFDDYQSLQCPYIRHEEGLSDEVEGQRNIGQSWVVRRRNN